MRLTTSPRQGRHREGGRKEAGDRTARRGTRTVEQAHVPGTSWHNTAKSGEPGERVNAALVQRHLTVLAGESCVVSGAGAGHGH